MKLETGRAIMIPTIRPLITLPTTRPRVASGARWAASGTMICTATEAEADQRRRKRGRSTREVAKAAAASAIALRPTAREV